MKDGETVNDDVESQPTQAATPIKEYKKCIPTAAVPRKEPIQDSLKKFVLKIEVFGLKLQIKMFGGL